MQQGRRQKNTMNKGKSGAGVVRIIGGRHRGRKLRFNAVDGLRPTLDRVRETLFNWIQADIAGARCLDLFAGSGALGFEAQSRGAKSVTMVELSPKVAAQLKSNAELLAAENIHVVNQAAQNFLKHNSQKFDLIFLDPPFGREMLSPVLNQLSNCLAEDGLIYIEHATNDAQWEQDWLTVVKQKSTSQLVYGLYRQTTSQDSAIS